MADTVVAKRRLPIWRHETIKHDRLRSLMQMIAPWDAPSILAFTFDADEHPRRAFLIRNGRLDHVDDVLQPVFALDPDATSIIVGAAPTFSLTVCNIRRSNTTQQEGENTT